MSEESYIFAVDGFTNFIQNVVEASASKPVLVDFWAEWCAPCKVLMPLLEKITSEYQGELLLAKVNCDEQQEVVAQMGVRNLPTVVLFKDGKPLDGFSGAQPESAIRQLLERHIGLPTPQAEEVNVLEQAQIAFDQGEFAQAEEWLKQLLTEDNTNEAALILFARCLAERNELEEAEAVLAAVKSDEHKQALAAAKAQIAFLREVEDLPEMAILKSRLAQNPQDDEACLQLALQHMARQQYEAALESLLQLFIRNRSFKEGAAHKTLLQIFDLLGNEHALVTQYRRKLYQALY
ncbi:thioredoxin [Pseudomonas sp. F1_0610]|uniref:thioredoxin n=1 Tax=Pseudomonas sp. F1_0610 TaxID=3114284 RepID=UPI0039C1464F